MRNLSQNGSGPSASPAPPLLDHFPPGSPGALIQKLAQIHLPLGERADTRATGGLAGMPGGNRGLGPAALATLSPALLDASLRAAIRQMPLGATMAALLSGDAKGIDPTLAEALRALRLNGLAKPDGPAIEQGVKQSGLFLEARLAQGLFSAGSHDLKSLLNAIRAGLAGGADPEAATAQPKPATPGLLSAADRPEASQPRSPDIARLVEGGLERIKLQQIASLPDHPA